MYETLQMPNPDGRPLASLRAFDILETGYACASSLCSVCARLTLGTIRSVGGAGARYVSCMRFCIGFWGAALGVVVVSVISNRDFGLV